MKILQALTAIIAAAVVADAAFAQATLGELKDAGAVKLSKAEIDSLLTGSNSTGPTAAGGSVSIDFKADGTYTGTFTTPAGKGGGSFGKWKVDDSGRYCTEGSAQSFGAAATANCGYFFKLSDGYFYVPESDTDRAARAMKRVIKK